jgi:hypothetical protein
MNFFGARQQTQQYIPKGGVPRPGWTYRGARRNAARDLQWPARYRWRRFIAAMKAKVMGTGAVPA